MSRSDWSPLFWSRFNLAHDHSLYRSDGSDHSGPAAGSNNMATQCLYACKHWEKATVNFLVTAFGLNVHSKVSQCHSISRYVHSEIENFRTFHNEICTHFATSLNEQNEAMPYFLPVALIFTLLWFSLKPGQWTMLSHVLQSLLHFWSLHWSQIHRASSLVHQSHGRSISWQAISGN